MHYTMAMAVVAMGGVALAAASGWLWDRRLRKLERDTGGRLARLESDVAALCNAGARAGDRLLDVDAKLRGMMEWQSQAELRMPATETLRHAITLAERGATADDLMVTCGLARGEAELMERFRRSAHSASPLTH